ncbi:MAG: EamA family transporter [Candidatus Aenigmarchaeota archaeon]|nr:EamA family transporter [Candidatus Aenigmarchaeota archaeon]
MVFAIPVNKFLITGLDPTIFTATRAIFIGIGFFILAPIQSKFNYKKFKKVPWKCLLAIGFIGGGLAFLLYFTGLKLTTSGRAAFLHKTLPIYTIILAFLFLKEKVTKKQVFAVVLMFIGAIIVHSAEIKPSEFWENPSLGDLLVIVATFLWGVENTIARGAMIKGESNFVVTFARMFFGAIFLFGAVLFLGKIYQLLTLTYDQVNRLLLSTTILFGYVLTWYWGIKYINVSKAAPLLLLAPVISLFLGVVWLDEPAPSIQLLGSALILVGAFIVSRIRSEFVTAA